MILNKISNSILKIENILIGLSLATMFISLTLEVLFRYFFNNPLEWSGELAMYSLAWTTFIGGSMAIKLKQASAVSIFTDRLAPNIQDVVSKIVLIVLTLFSFVLLFYSAKWILNPSVFGEVSRSLRVPIIIPYASVPVGFLFMCIHSLALLVEPLRKE